MTSRFFIDRPVFASVLSIVIVIGGLAAMRVLPIAQYPQIVPPQVLVTATYPGASAETIAATVAAPLEQQINGVENMLYMQSSNSTGGHACSLTVTFKIGTDPDQATINVNNRVQRAMPCCRRRCGAGRDRQQAVERHPRRSSRCRRPTAGYDSIFICELCADQRDRRAAAHAGRRRCLAVRRHELFDADLAAARQARAVRSDAGRRRRRDPRAERSNSPPAASARSRTQTRSSFTYSVTTQGRLAGCRTSSRTSSCARTSTAAALRLKDVARVELGAQNYASSDLSTAARPCRSASICSPAPTPCRWPSPPSRTRWTRLAQRFPRARYSSAVRHHPLRRGLDRGGDPDLRRGDGAGRAGRLPVPAELCAPRSSRSSPCRCRSSAPSPACTLLGFSINLLTLFGLVLAIGIVVDDAIVVLENVERIMRREHCSPRDAADQGDERGHRAGHRHRAGAVRGVHPGRRSSAASPASSTGSSPSPSRSRW